MSDKDYSLLRPFDLEAAKAGAAICYSHLMSVVEFVGEATAIGCIATKEEDGRIAITPRSQFRLAPLCWVEGKPVYKGDVLYSKFFGGTFEATGLDHLQQIKAEKIGICAATCIDSCTWTPPKVKREGWVNVYPVILKGEDIVAQTSYAWPSKADAENVAGSTCIACVRIEWEEQP